MSGKYLINSIENFVRESLYGFSKIHLQLKVDLDNNVVFDPSGKCEGQKVGIVAGGGSGHEPFPSGYVGSGMFTASVSGPVFVSPPPKQILRAVRLAASLYDEVLLIVPNYTGDVLNFGLAAEMAIEEGIKVERLVLGEDIAQICQGIQTKAGRRGTCGLILVSKIAGYLAALGNNASDIRLKCVDLMQDLASMGLCLNACSKLTGTGNLFDLKEDELELGIGVHGEPGVGRSTLTTAREAIKSLLVPLTLFLKIRDGDQVVAMVNNLGSLTHLEQCLVAGEIEKQLTAKGIQIVKLYGHHFFTSLNMAGIQICILKLSDTNKEMVLKGLDYPTTAPAWPSAPPFDVSPPGTFSFIRENERGTEELFAGASISFEKSQLVKKCLKKISENLISAENELNRLDSVCGDGDCGTTFKCFAEVILKRIEEEKLNFSKPSSLFAALSSCAQENVGGTTGALYGLFLLGVSKQLTNYEHFDGPLIYGECWRRGIETIKKYSLARLGDRTMLDALETGCRAYEEFTRNTNAKGLESFEKAVEAAIKGCEQTKTMIARAGRASYTDASKQREIDSGAMAVTIWLSTILQIIQDNSEEQNQY